MQSNSCRTETFTRVHRVQWIKHLLSCFTGINRESESVCFTQSYFIDCYLVLCFKMKNERISGFSPYINDGYATVVATTTQIFNEFSSVAQDVSAIRDFVKMFYDRAIITRVIFHAIYWSWWRFVWQIKPTFFKYQFCHILSKLWILNQTQTYMSDDFGLLDDAEGDWYNGEIVDLRLVVYLVKSVH